MFKRIFVLCLVSFGTLFSGAITSCFADTGDEFKQANQNIFSLMDAGDYAKAESATDKLAADFSRHQNLPVALYWIGRRWEWASRFEKANRVFQQIIQKYPENQYASEAKLSISRIDVMTLIMSQDYGRAGRALDKMLADFPGHRDLPETLYSIAERYRWFSKFEEEKRVYQRIIQNHPDSPYANKAKLGISRAGVMSVIMSQHYDRAKEALDKLLANFSEHPDLPESLCWIAERYEWLGKYEEAKSIYQQVIKNYRNSSYTSEAKFGFSRTDIMCLIESQNYDQAKGNLDKLIADFSKHRDLAKVLWQIARRYEQSKKSKESLQLHQYNVDRFPRDIYAMWSQVEIIKSHIRNANYTAADAAYDKLLTVFSAQPTLPKEIYQFANTYNKVGRNDKAGRLYQYIIDNWSKTEQAIWAKASKARLNILLGNESTADAAIIDLISDFKGHPELAFLLTGIGEKYCYLAFQDEKEGRDTEAKNHFEKALAIWQRVTQDLPPSAGTASAYYHSAVCYRHWREYEKAIEHFQKVVSDWPDNEYAAEAQLRIGNCYEGLRHTGTLSETEANHRIEQAYKAVVEKYPGSSFVKHACLKLGQMNFNRSQWIEAAMYFELFLEKAHDDQQRVNVLYDLGRAYEQMGELNLAAKVYSAFIELADLADPRIKSVKAKLEKLEGIKK